MARAFAISTTATLLRQSAVASASDGCCDGRSMRQKAVPKKCRHGLVGAVGVWALFFAAREDSDLERDHKAATGRQVELIERRCGCDCVVGRSIHRNRAVKGKDVGDVFAVEQVVDAEADLRFVEEGVSAERVVEEEIDVVERG